MEQRLSPFYKEGLTSEQVQKQIALGKKNDEPEKITKTTWEIIQDNVFTLFNLYNFMIAIALAFVGAYSNLFFILIIIINISMGVIQEFRAKQLVEELAVLNAPKVEVVRNGKVVEILTEDVVLDDVLLFESGRQIVADSIILHGVVEVNEALLTGESDAILKSSGDMLLSGSFLVSGKCYAQVEHIGIDNYATKLAHEAKSHKQVFSELLTSMQKVTKFTSFLIIPLGILLFLEAYFLRSNIMKEAVVSTAAALLGMLPKGLMLLISISLGTGVIKLSKKNILVQELYSLESLAHVDVLCLDKTGTITEGNMQVEKVYMLNHHIAQKPFTEMMQKFLAAVDDNNATFQALSQHFGEITSKEVIATMPFSSERKWSSASFSDIGTVLLGAPERLLDHALPEEIQKQIITGGRVLIIAHTQEAIDNATLPEKIVPLAAVLLIDPIRENAHATLEYFRREGVDVKIISGDNPVAVSGIAKKAGFADYQSYIDMSTLDQTSDVIEAAQKYNIFGRVSPQQKKELIIALKAQGHTVAMTGDGVNDVLALREADCSIAIAEGSDAAKQISQLVLLDSDFASLPHVVLEGRRVVNNVTKLASIFFIKTIYSVLLSILCIILNISFPFIPIQITLIDLAIEGYPSFFMSFEEDGRKIKGTFLPNVFRNALPNALMITLMVMLMFIIGKIFSLDNTVNVTIMYYLIGFISILAVIKASIPFNKLRVFLCVTVLVGFYVATVLFHGLLHIELLNLQQIGLTVVLAMISIVGERALAKVMNQLFYRKNLH